MERDCLEIQYRINEWVPKRKWKKFNVIVVVVVCFISLVVSEYDSLCLLIEWYWVFGSDEHLGNYSCFFAKVTIIETQQLSERNVLKG